MYDASTLGTGAGTLDTAIIIYNLCHSGSHTQEHMESCKVPCPNKAYGCPKLPLQSHTCRDSIHSFQWCSKRVKDEEVSFQRCKDLPTCGSVTKTTYTVSIASGVWSLWLRDHKQCSCTLVHFRRISHITYAEQMWPAIWKGTIWDFHTILLSFWYGWIVLSVLSAMVNVSRE